MAKFFRGERVVLTHKVVFIDEFDYNDKKFARVAFEDKPWTFIIGINSLSKYDYCKDAPFPKCNNAEGCDTCEYRHQEED